MTVSGLLQRYREKDENNMLRQERRERNWRLQSLYIDCWGWPVTSDCVPSNDGCLWQSRIFYSARKKAHDYVRYEEAEVRPVLSMNAVYFMNFIVELLVLSMFTVLLSIIEFDSNTIMSSTARIQDDRANKISECAETWHQFMVIIQAARTKFTKVIKV